MRSSSSLTVVVVAADRLDGVAEVHHQLAVLPAHDVVAAAPTRSPPSRRRPPPRSAVTSTPSGTDRCRGWPASGGSAPRPVRARGARWGHHADAVHAVEPAQHRALVGDAVLHETRPRRTAGATVASACTASRVASLFTASRTTSSCRQSTSSGWPDRPDRARPSPRPATPAAARRAGSPRGAGHARSARPRARRDASGHRRLRRPLRLRTRHSAYRHATQHAARPPRRPRQAPVAAAARIAVVTEHPPGDAAAGRPHADVSVRVAWADDAAAIARAAGAQLAGRVRRPDPGRHARRAPRGRVRGALAAGDRPAARKPVSECSSRSSAPPCAGSPRPRRRPTPMPTPRTTRRSPSSSSTPTTGTPVTGRGCLHAAIDTMRSDKFQRATIWVVATDDRRRGFLTDQGWAADGAHRELDLHGDGTVLVKSVRLHTDLTP